MTTKLRSNKTLQQPHSRKDGLLFIRTTYKLILRICSKQWLSASLKGRKRASSTTPESIWQSSPLFRILNKTQLKVQISVLFFPSTSPCSLTLWQVILSRPLSRCWLKPTTKPLRCNYLIRSTPANNSKKSNLQPVLKHSIRTFKC
jgi:hypothetical protein